MSKMERSWLAQEFIDEFGLVAYDLLLATAHKHDPKRFDTAAKKAATFGPLGYDLFCAALHIIEKHGCLKSIGDLHHFCDAFDRESVYQWLHGDDTRRAWSVAFNPYKSFYKLSEHETAVDFVGGLHSHGQIAAHGAEIAKRTGVPGFLFAWPTGAVVSKSVKWDGVFEVKTPPQVFTLDKKKKKAPSAMTLKQAAKNDKAMTLANQIINKMLEEEMSALPKWMPDAN